MFMSGVVASASIPRTILMLAPRDASGVAFFFAVSVSVAVGLYLRRLLPALGYGILIGTLVFDIGFAIGSLIVAPPVSR